MLNQHTNYNSMQHAKQVALLSAKTQSVERETTECHPSTSDRIVDKLFQNDLIPSESPLVNDIKLCGWNCAKFLP